MIYKNYVLVCDLQIYKLLHLLPREVLFQGVTFKRFLIIKHEGRKELCLGYEIISVDMDSQHYNSIMNYGNFYNPLLYSNCGFLVLYEGIYTAADLLESLNKLFEVFDMLKNLKYRPLLEVISLITSNKGRPRRRP